MKRSEFDKRKKLLNKTKHVPLGYLIGVIIYTIITGNFIAGCVALLIGIIPLTILVLYARSLSTITIEEGG